MNVLIGILEISHICYMADSVILKNLANNLTIVNAVETVMDNFQIPKENLLLLISDRAPYNVKAFCTS
ncbi:hypothetical protein A3Q56_08584 [Intoshia linei]|uniref:Uncharacterized protein n=1 Tax=Intoshia linei TaxID=1819745 RepID=A0A177APG7_9BILA|nr:hypothetical protein A3Q56_08584 [Intoshia linei]